MVYIGIDLGTTYSCVAIIEHRALKILFDDEGRNFIPSIVSFGDKDIRVGNPALNYHDLSSALYDSKRLLGWKFMNNLPIAENRLLWTFNLDTRDNKVGYVLNKEQPNERFVTPEEVSAEILKKIKAIAETYIGSQVTGVVITIPANFQDNQIAATKRAIEMAGLELKLLIEEPTAAAIAYNAERELDDSMIMIFDFGGGTLDISICEIRNGKITIKAVAGDEHLGGQDFDGIIMNHVYAEYMQSSNDDISVNSRLSKRPRRESEMSKNDIFSNPRLTKQLRDKCRNAKESLSFTATEINIKLDVSNGPDLNVKLTRTKFNDLCDKLIKKAMKLVDTALNMVRTSANDIDHVILVGGSTRIPVIRDLLGEKFNRNKLRLNINPNEAVVFGAAILADAIEKKKLIPLINNTMNELSWNINNSHEILLYFYYRNNGKDEGRIGLFDSYTCSVEEIAEFQTCYLPFQVATTQNKIFGISSSTFEIYDLNTRQISKGPDPSEWRQWASVAYFKDKLYYLGGRGINRVDVLINGKWQTGPALPLPISAAQTIICDEILYVIDGCESRKIYRLSDDEREWIEIGETQEKRSSLGVSSLNGRIYITGGVNYPNALQSCLCFDPSAPVDNRISEIADMNYARQDHSLVATNGKLYAIGGYFDGNFCDSIEEYDPQTNKWREVGKINLQIGGDNSFNNIVCIGIDLGTTYSCVAVLENDQPVSIPCDNGLTIIPSIVGYCEDVIVVGSTAVSVGIQSENILHDSKRLIGWGFLYDLPTANPDLWPFKVDTRNNSAGYILNKRRENEQFVKPEEVSAEILKVLKTAAEKHIKKEVNCAVVTVPAQFNSKQRAATKRAAELAGLELKYLLEEPIASALAYNQKMKLDNSRLLIVDFGGGTLDITIIEIIDQFLEVKALTGDQHLGGRDIDNRIMKYVISQHHENSPRHNFRDPYTLRKLKTVCCERKEALAYADSVSIMIDPNNQDDTPINVRLTQEKLNELCNDIFTKITTIVDGAMKTADLAKEGINYVILVGGSTRIKKVRQIFMDKFSEEKIRYFDISPNEAVAFGAAIVADAIAKRQRIPSINLPYLF